MLAVFVDSSLCFLSRNDLLYRLLTISDKDNNRTTAFSTLSQKYDYDTNTTGYTSSAC